MKSSGLPSSAKSSRLSGDHSGGLSDERATDRAAVSGGARIASARRAALGHVHDAEGVLQLQRFIGNRAVVQLLAKQGRGAPAKPVQRKNTTGMPDSLKTGVEDLSGVSMDDVTVHYNSAQPAKVEAVAYSRGTEIHLGPGQEEHLAHEAWHVAQQKQGRVSANAQVNGMAVNDDRGLEREADEMGGRAAAAGYLSSGRTSGELSGSAGGGAPVVQMISFAEMLKSADTTDASVKAYIDTLLKLKFPGDNAPKIEPLKEEKKANSNDDKSIESDEHNKELSTFYDRQSNTIYVPQSLFNARDKVELWDAILYEAQNAINEPKFKEVDKLKKASSKTPPSEYGSRLSGIEFESTKMYMNNVKGLGLEESKLPQQAKRALVKLDEWEKMGDDKAKKQFTETPHKNDAAKNSKASLATKDLYAYELVENWDDTKFPRLKILEVLEPMRKQLKDGKQNNSYKAITAALTPNPNEWPKDDKKEQRIGLYEEMITSTILKVSNMAPAEFAKYSPKKKKDDNGLSKDDIDKIKKEIIAELKGLRLPATL
jgi:hypothetical protein